MIIFILHDSLSDSRSFLRLVRRREARAGESQKVSFYLISKLKLLVLNNIMSLLDYSWHFANNLHAARRKEELMFK